ncbi:hypothetical protein U5640_15910 [Streptomyces sp. SS7]|uniref:hypothetical protein n=1 Tax=Streptomyces sp. SS7 TaxID=3108485 RepID=UPI0030EE67CF
MTRAGDLAEYRVALTEADWAALLSVVLARADNSTGAEAVKWHRIYRAVRRARIRRSGEDQDA